MPVSLAELSLSLSERETERERENENENEREYEGSRSDLANETSGILDGNENGKNDDGSAGDDNQDGDEDEDEDNMGARVDEDEDFDWRTDAKHIFIISDAGKPIFSLHAEEHQALVPLTGCSDFWSHRHRVD